MSVTLSIFLLDITASEPQSEGLLFSFYRRTVRLRKVNKWLRVTWAVIEGAWIWPQVFLVLNTVYMTISFSCLSNLLLRKCILILNKSLKPTHGLTEEGAFICFAHQHHIWLKSHHSLHCAKPEVLGVQVQPLRTSLHALHTLADLRNLAGFFSVF